MPYFSACRCTPHSLRRRPLRTAWLFLFNFGRSKNKMHRNAYIHNPLTQSPIHRIRMQFFAGKRALIRVRLFCSFSFLVCTLNEPNEAIIYARRFSFLK